MKDKDRHVVLGALVVLGRFFGAFFLAAHVSYAMVVTIGAAWMGGVWWTVNSERALKKDVEEALGKAHAAAERAADLRRQIEGSRYLREGTPADKRF